MEKEKFDCNAPHINISKIVNKNSKLNENQTNVISNSTIDFINKNNEKYKQNILHDLIKKYGKEEGKSRFELWEKETEASFQDYQNIVSSSEEREETVNIKKR